MTASIVDLHRRSVVEKWTGCWHWQGATRKDGLPAIWTHDYDRGEARAMAGPRAVWMIANKQAPAGFPYRCCARDCVNPQHLRLAKTRKEMAVAVGKAGRLNTPKADAARHVNLKLAREARGVIDTPEHAVRAIRASTEPLKVLAAEFGISLSAVSQIRLGKARIGVAA